MQQLPIFVTLAGRRVILLGEGEAAEAKRRLIERAGGLIVGEDAEDARLAFVALDDAAAEAAAARLKARGLLVNVVDRPDLCDFTTPAIIDRDPVLIAIGTGGASAGLAKALRQRLEAMLPQGLGTLADALFRARDAIRARWPAGADRRRAIDRALDPAGPLDPLADLPQGAVDRWLATDFAMADSALVTIPLFSDDPDELTLRAARLLGRADHIYHDAMVPDAILSRARADAVRIAAPPPDNMPAGLSLYLRRVDQPR